MGLELGDVLSRVAVRRAEDEDERLVDRGAVARIAEAVEAEAPAGQRGGRDARPGAEPVGNRERAVAGKAHDRDAGRPGSGGERRDGRVPGGRGGVHAEGPASSAARTRKTAAVQV